MRSVARSKRRIELGDMSENRKSYNPELGVDTAWNRHERNPAVNSNLGIEGVMDVIVGARSRPG